MRKRHFWLGLFALVLMAGAVILRSEHSGVSAVSDVAGVAMDSAQGRRLNVSFELADPTKGEGQSVGSKRKTVLAGSLTEALRLAGLGGEYPVTLTHGSLVVIDEALLPRLGELGQMLLSEWQGQSDVYLAVARGGSAAEILSSDEGGNLRAGLLSAQIRRAVKNGQVKTEPMLSLISSLLAGETVSLPVVESRADGYQIVGSIEVKG